MKECVHVKEIILVKRNEMLRFDRKNIQILISESSRHLKGNPTHAFTQKVLMTAPINDRVRKNRHL